MMMKWSHPSFALSHLFPSSILQVPGPETPDHRSGPEISGGTNSVWTCSPLLQLTVQFTNKKHRICFKHHISNHETSQTNTSQIYVREGSPQAAGNQGYQVPLPIQEPRSLIITKVVTLNDRFTATRRLMNFCKRTVHFKIQGNASD